MAILKSLTMSCNEDNDDVNRVGRINDDLSFCTKFKGWAVSERRTFVLLSSVNTGLFYPRGSAWRHRHIWREQVVQ